MQEGQGDRFEDFVTEAQRDLRRLCWALTGDRGLGEDLAQTALEKVWRRWARIDGDPFAYARRVAVNESVSWKRRRSWRNEIATDLTTESHQSAATAWESSIVLGAGAEGAVAGLDIERWLRRLPDKHRAVIVLRYLLDLSIEESAAALNCSPGTVKSRSFRALNQLRETIDAADPHEYPGPVDTTTSRSTPSDRENADDQNE